MGRASSKAHSTDEKREVDYYQSLNIDFDQLDGAKERLSLQHDILREIFHGNFSSPISNLLQAGDAKVLNIGCGNGVWLFEMNSDFSDLFFVGIDKSPQLFPQSKPSNVQFVISDMQKGLPFQSDSFDFVYMRFLALNFRDSEWDNLIKESIRVLKPGCWLEITDVETDVKNPGPYTTKMTNEAIKFLGKRSINPQVIFLTEEFIKSSNIHNIQHMERYFPLGSWYTRLSYACDQHARDLFSVMLTIFGRGMGVKHKDIGKTLNLLMEEFNNNRSYIHLHRFCGQKKMKKKIVTNINHTHAHI